MRPSACSIADALRANSRLRGGAVAVACTVTGLSVTHAELYRRVRHLSRTLRARGLRRGDRVGLAGANSLLHVECYAAALFGGFTVVPVGPELRRAAVDEIGAETAIRAVLGLDEAVVGAQFDGGAADVVVRSTREYAELMRDAGSGGGGGAGVAEDAEEEEDAEEAASALSVTDDWAILFTSGTTSGRQKGVVRTQEGSILGFFTHTGPMGLDESTRGLVAFPLHGVSSFFFAFLYLYVGGSMVIVDLVARAGRAVAAGAAVRAAIRDHAVTFVTLSPLLLREVFPIAPSADAATAAAAAPSDSSFPSVRTILVTGAFSCGRFRVDLRDSFAQAVRVFDVYGSTEAGAITFLTPDMLDACRDLDGCVGAEPPGVSLCVLVDPEDASRVVTAPYAVGRVHVRTTMMMSRYAHEDCAPKAETAAAAGTAPCVAAGYLDQGDLGMRLPSGLLCLKGRADDMIVHRSGFNVYPLEVETVLRAHAPFEAEVHVVGLPASHKAEKIAAVVVRLHDAGSGGGVSDEAAVAALRAAA
eukprot:Rhum_TRINITY_DN14170_c3_g1::Rhum_TRINITY_DN14170_c3_g1_i1::g.72770::m.72770